MIIFKDVFTHEEIISDVYKLQPVKVGDEAASAENPVLLEADCAMITIGAVEVNTGANASAEEADEGLEDSARKVIDIIESFNLKQAFYDKAMFKIRVQTYSKKLREYLKTKGKSDDEIKAITGPLSKFFAGQVLKKFDEWEFYIGENDDPDPALPEQGMVVLLNYREDGVTPYVVVIRPGLYEYKV